MGAVEKTDLSVVIAGLDPAIHDAFPQEKSFRYFPRGASSWMPGSSPGMTPNVWQASTMTELAWSLHPQLAKDTVPVGDLALSRVLLANDANYPWLILVPRRDALTEIIDLDENEQVQLLGEIDAAAARVLKSVTQCDKLNIAALGNMVAQLHVHVIARFASDAAWPKPVWGAVPPSVYDPGTRDALIGAIRRGLQIRVDGV